jgi:hypothetical protein
VLPTAKVPISLRVDADVLEFFRESGPRYQSRMNAVLRSYMERASKLAPKRRRRRGIAQASPPVVARDVVRWASRVVELQIVRLEGTLNHSTAVGHR